MQRRNGNAFFAAVVAAALLTFNPAFAEEGIKPQTRRI